MRLPKLYLLLLLAISAAAQTTQQTPQTLPALPANDEVRVQEFYRLAGQIQNRIWPEWSNTPAPIILVTKDAEYIFHHPSPPKEFVAVEGGQHARPRQFPVGLLATFPAFGPPSVIVVGEPANTQSKTSTPWLFTLMHEHFHQLQDAQPGALDLDEKLGLNHGDKTGMWMLDFPFPYKEPSVIASFTALRDQLLAVVQESDATEFKKKARAYAQARKKFFAQLKEDDGKYLEFQLWKEGIARYIEVHSAEAGAQYEPTSAYKALPDYQAFSEYAKQARNKTLAECKDADLAKWQRTVVYSFGATEGFLLDRISPQWTKEYFKQPFTLAPEFEAIH